MVSTNWTYKLSQQKVIPLGFFHGIGPFKIMTYLAHHLGLKGQNFGEINQIFDICFGYCEKRHSPTRCGLGTVINQALYRGLIEWPIKISYTEGILFPKM